MNNTITITVSGPPKSGKSAIAAFIADALTEQLRNSQGFIEVNDDSIRSVKSSLDILPWLPTVDVVVNVQEVRKRFGEDLDD